VSGFRGHTDLPEVESGMCGRPSEPLDAVVHLFGFVNVPEEGQAPDDLTETPRLLMTIRDARVGRTGRVEFQGIFVLGKNDSPFTPRERQLFFVRGLH
jgi:hypothetical protein